MPLGVFRYKQRWSGLHVPAELDQAVPQLENRDRDIEDYLSSVGISIDALKALSAGYIKSNGTGGFTSQAAPIPATEGGTGQTGYTTGDLLYANTGTTLAKLNDVATGNALISGGVGTAPSWGKIQLTGTPTHINGTLQVGNGGTGATTLTGYVKGNGTSAFTAQAVPIPVSDGGSGATTLTGYVKGNGTSAFTASSTVPASDITNTNPTAYTPTFGGITLGNGTVEGGYTLLGPLCFWYAFLRQGSTTTRSATLLSVTLPVTARTFATQQELAGAVEVFYVDNSISSVIFWHGTGKYGTTTLELEDLTNNAQGTDDTNTMAANGTDPFGAAWATDDKIMVKGWYWRA